MRDYVARTIAAYDKKAEELAVQYESGSFEEVHSEWIRFLPSRGGEVLDVGCGTGRDAAALSSLGYEVTAIEPSLQLLAIGKRLHRGAHIQWVQDALPELASLNATRFDFILVSGVFGHLDTIDRSRSLHRLGALISDGGRLVISVRSVPAVPDERQYFEVSVSEMVANARIAGLRNIAHAEVADKMGRKDIKWTILVFEKAE